MITKNIREWKSLVGCSAIGADVSKAKLNIAGIVDDAAWQGILKNDEDAMTEFFNALKEGGFSGTIICEATSHYHMLFALLACEAGLDIRVINPLLSSKHAKGRIRKTKTDAVDAITLATMVLTEPDLPPSLKMTRLSANVRSTIGFLHGIEKSLQSLKRSLASYGERLNLTRTELPQPCREMQKSIESLEVQRKKLIMELDRSLAESEAENEPKVEALASLPGVTKENARLLLSVLRMDVPSSKSWIAYLGMDVSVRESGTWKGRGKLTKRGSAWLRKRIIQAAWGAKMHDKHVQSYYKALKEQGRAHKEALVIIARKLLRMMFHAAKTGEHYDPNRAFAVAKA